MLTVYLWGLLPAYLLLCYGLLSSLPDDDGPTGRWGVVVQAVRFAVVAPVLLLGWPFFERRGHDLAALWPVSALVIGLTLVWPATLSLALVIALWSAWGDL
jgi:hypothetical protein